MPERSCGLDCHKYVLALSVQDTVGRLQTATDSQTNRATNENTPEFTNMGPESLYAIGSIYFHI